MGKVKTQVSDMPLKRAFLLSVFVTVALVVGLSALTIAGCAAFRGWLMPESDEVFLTVCEESELGQSRRTVRLTLGETMPDSFLFGIEESGGSQQQPAEVRTTYSVEKIENSYSALTPKRKLAYAAAGVAMVALPVLFSVTGLLLCALWFYRNKLAGPIKALGEAAECIAAQNLDFTVEQFGGDELGALCASFEKMRTALHNANRELWATLEERRLLQASIAHDLRNPIAVIEGYAEYMLLNLPEDRLSREQLLTVAGNLSAAAGRLGRYTESIRDIGSIEELTVNRGEAELSAVLGEIIGEMGMLAQKQKLEFSVDGGETAGRINIDAAVFGRVMENVFSNALRFAGTEICVAFELCGEMLTATISDDGCGFAEKQLAGRKRLAPTGGDADGHMGMGLVISGILCRKHGGALKLDNRPTGGACVRATFRVGGEESNLTKN